MRLLATRAMRHYYRQLRVCDCFSFTNYQNRLNKGGSGTRLRLSQQILENVECGRLRLRKKFCKCWIFSFLGQKTNFADRWSIWIRIFTDGFSSELRPRAVQLSVCRSEGASTQHISKYCKLLPTYMWLVCCCRWLRTTSRTTCGSSARWRWPAPSGMTYLPTPFPCQFFYLSIVLFKNLIWTFLTKICSVCPYFLLYFTEHFLSFPVSTSTGCHPSTGSSFPPSWRDSTTSFPAASSPSSTSRSWSSSSQVPHLYMIWDRIPAFC